MNRDRDRDATNKLNNNPPFPANWVVTFHFHEETAASSRNYLAGAAVINLTNR